jgi:hypothetical protein
MWKASPNEIDPVTAPESKRAKSKHGGGGVENENSLQSAAFPGVPGVALQGSTVAYARHV